MATYSYNQPVGGVFAYPKDEVRFLLNDTSPKAPDSLTDEELAYVLAQTAGSDVRRAAALGARRMARTYSRKSGVTSKSVNGISISYSYADLAATYMSLADELEHTADQGGSAYGIIFTGAGDRSVFGQGQFDNGEQIGGGSWLSPNSWS